MEASEGPHKQIGLVVWAKYEGWPWWPGVIITRIDALSTCTAKAFEKLPKEKATNTTVRFFEVDGDGDVVSAVGVVEAKCVQEFIGGMGLHRRAGRFKDDINLCMRAAGRWIRSKGLPGQKEKFKQFIESERVRTAGITKHRNNAAVNGEVKKNQDAAGDNASKNGKDKECKEGNSPVSEPGDIVQNGFVEEMLLESSEMDGINSLQTAEVNQSSTKNADETSDQVKLVHNGDVEDGNTAVAPVETSAPEVAKATSLESKEKAVECESERRKDPTQEGRDKQVNEKINAPVESGTTSTPIEKTPTYLSQNQSSEPQVTGSQTN